MPSSKIVMKSYLTPEEYEHVSKLAAQTGLSLSTFAKRVCLGQPTPSLELQQFRRELLKINADLGRLGGLFKLCLSNQDENSKPLHQETRSILWQIEARQRELKDVVSRFKGDP